MGAGTFFFSVGHEHVQVFDACHCAADMEPAPGEVNVFPFEPAQFSDPDAGIHTQQDAEGKGVHITLQEGIQLFVILTAHDLYIAAA